MLHLLEVTSCIAVSSSMSVAVASVVVTPVAVASVVTPVAVAFVNPATIKTFCYHSVDPLAFATSVDFASVAPACVS